MNSEAVERHLIAESVFKTGNPWIDDALAGGLNKENFMLVAAKTGTGKTFFGVQLASFAARACKNVHYFALEAEKNEIQRRRLYYSVSRIIHKQYPTVSMPRYREWLHLGVDSQWEAIEREANEEIEKNESSLKTVYANGIYTPEMFQMDVVDLIASPEKPDLVIIDHLHHFFLSGDEIESLKTCIHQLKRLKDDLEVPVVVLAQLRKNDAGMGSKRTLPKLEDIRGTASLTDVATDVIIISGVQEEKIMELPEKINFPMYFHLAKSRTAAEATKFAGIVGFDFSTGCYDSKYAVTQVNAFSDPSLLEKIKSPKWAKNAVFPKITSVAEIKNWREQYDD